VRECEECEECQECEECGVCKECEGIWGNVGECEGAGWVVLTVLEMRSCEEPAA
jgi:hypothetical protein